MSNYIGSVVKLKIYEDTDVLNMIIAYHENSYLCVVYPYGHVTDLLIKVEKCDIIKVLHTGFDFTKHSVTFKGEVTDNGLL
jgi:hypothetical protein